MAEIKAALALESGRVFLGRSFGAEGEVSGEVVFNTSMTGYQEILTDPSYQGQIVTMTCPHIGNYGVSPEDMESRRTFASGFVVREASALFSSWRARESLTALLQSAGMPGIDGIDTRALTRHIRESGSLKGVISTRDLDSKSLVKKAKRSAGLAGRDLVKEVTNPNPYDWKETSGFWRERTEANKGESGGPPKPEGRRRVVVMDFGVKQNILRCLADREFQVKVVPAATGADEILALNPNGIVLSNGPGDPEAVTYAIQTIESLIKHCERSKGGLPILGICLGHQLLGLAFGGTTYKLKFGHHGANHPVKDVTTQHVEITTQNHGFAVKTKKLSGGRWVVEGNPEIEVTHVNLNDQTCEGMRHAKLPIFSVQYHPEASAGPHDSRYLFDRFAKLVAEAKRA
jgi:carbamoyl-phosphate synthase small subunit